MAIIDGNFRSATLHCLVEQFEELRLCSSHLDFAMGREALTKVDLVVIHVLVELLLAGHHDRNDSV